MDKSRILGVDSSQMFGPAAKFEGYWWTEMKKALTSGGRMKQSGVRNDSAFR